MSSKFGSGKCLDGMVFGRLTVLREGPRREVGSRSHRQAVCQCSCDAKTVKLVRVEALTGGHTLSCGCQRLDSAHARKRSFDGQVFGRLTVLRDAPFKSPSDKNRMVWCRCICGVEKIIALASLKTGATTSCGCYNREFVSRSKTIHGHAKGGKYTPEYICWMHMWRRCTTPSRKEYKHYGGRGITVCPEWESFENFLKDMGPRPKDHSIERIDVNGNYEPGNTTWATRTQQARNKRETVYVEYGGKKIRMIELAEMAGMTYHKLYNRLYLFGWSVEKAVADSPLLWEL